MIRLGVRASASSHLRARHPWLFNLHEQHATLHAQVPSTVSALGGTEAVAAHLQPERVGVHLLAHTANMCVTRHRATLRMCFSVRRTL